MSYTVDFEGAFDIRQAPFIDTDGLREERSNLFSVSQIIIDKSEEKLNDEISHDCTTKILLVKISLMFVIFAYWVYCILVNKDLGGRLEVVFGFILLGQYALLITIQVKEFENLHHRIGQLEFNQVSIVYFAMSISLLLWRILKYREKLVLNIIVPIVWISIISLTCVLNNMNLIIMYNFKLENNIDAKDIFIVKNSVPMIKHRSNYKNTVEKISSNYDKILNMKTFIKIEAQVTLFTCCCYLIIIIIIIINARSSLAKRLITIEFLNLSMCFMLHSTFKKAEVYKKIANNLSELINCSTSINLDTELDTRYPIIIFIIASAFLLSETVLAK